MPISQERNRGLRYYRTIDVGRGKYIHIAVVRKAGKRGGHTIAGPVHKVKMSRFRKFILARQIRARYKKEFPQGINLSFR